MIELFFMELNYDRIYCLWSFSKSKLIIDKALMPLIVSTFRHFVELEVYIFFYINLHFCDMKIITNFLFTEANKQAGRRFQKSKRGSKYVEFSLDGPHQIKLDLDLYVMIQTPHKSVSCLIIGLLVYMLLFVKGDAFRI